MDTTETPIRGATHGKADWRIWWERTATGLAIIELIDVTGQIVKWAAAVHWIVLRYAAVKAYMFRYLPFHVPERFRTAVILFTILLSVANVGFYRRRRKLLILAILGFLASMPFILATTILELFGPRVRRLLHYDALEAVRNKLDYACLVGDLGTAALMLIDSTPLMRGALWVRYTASLFIGLAAGVLLSWAMILTVRGFRYDLPSLLEFEFALVALLAIIVGIVIAWRWVFVTVALFLAVLTINQAYVWLN